MAAPCFLAVLVFSVITQLASLPLFSLGRRVGPVNTDAERVFGAQAVYVPPSVFIEARGALVARAHGEKSAICRR